MSKIKEEQMDLEEPVTFSYKNENSLSLFQNLDSYMKMQPPDCSLFSADGHEIQSYKTYLCIQFRIANKLYTMSGYVLYLQIDRHTRGPHFLE